jgi:hypothetical protein
MWARLRAYPTSGGLSLLTMINTLAYFGIELITVVKSFKKDDGEA